MTSSTWRSSALMVSMGFAISGMLTGGLMQADVVAYEQTFGLNHEQVSFWLSLFSVLTAVGGAVAGGLADRRGAGGVYRGCMVLSGLGLMIFACPHIHVALAGFLAAGFGVGGLIVGNILVSKESTGEPNRALNQLHAIHASARFLGVVLSVFSLGGLWQYSYVALGAAFLALATSYVPGEASSAASRPTGKDLDLDTGWIAGVGAGFFLYMTAEMVLITWLPAYFEKDRLWTSAWSKAVYGMFLAGLITGRFWCSRMWPREWTPRACGAAAIVHLAAIAVVLWIRHPAAVAAALFVAGLCEGPGWPALFAFSIRHAAGQEGKFTGIIYVLCCVAIVVSTAGSGIIAQRAGLESVFYVVAAAHVLFSVIFYRLLTGPRGLQ